MSTTIIDKMRYQIKWLTQQVECIKEKGCLCFSFETGLTYNPETGELSATFVDDSTRTVTITPAPTEVPTLQEVTTQGNISDNVLIVTGMDNLSSVEEGLIIANFPNNRAIIGYSTNGVQQGNLFFSETESGLLYPSTSLGDIGVRVREEGTLIQGIAETSVSIPTITAGPPRTLVTKEWVEANSVGSQNLDQVLTEGNTTNQSMTVGLGVFTGLTPSDIDAASFNVLVTREWVKQNTTLDQVLLNGNASSLGATLGSLNVDSTIHAGNIVSLLNITTGGNLEVTGYGQFGGSLEVMENIVSQGIIESFVTIAEIDTGGPKTVITKEYADANYAGGGGTTPTLDEVLTEGNTSDQAISLSSAGSLSTLDIENTNTDQFSRLGAGSLTFSGSGSNTGQLTSDYLLLQGNGSGYSGTYREDLIKYLLNGNVYDIIPPPDITANRTVAFPDKSGTIALLSDIEVAPKGQVAFIFDDGFISHRDVVKPIFDARGIKGGLAMSNRLIEAFQRLRADELQDFQKDGWEILGHSVNHETMNTSSIGIGYKRVEAEVKLNIDQFKSYGFHVDGWVTPSSIMDDSFISALHGRFNYGFTKSNGANPIQDYSDRYKLPRFSLEQNTLLQAQEAADAAIDNNQVIVFYTHDVTAGSQKETDLIAIVDYCIAQGYEIVTPREALKKRYDFQNYELDDVTIIEKDINSISLLNATETTTSGVMTVTPDTATSTVLAQSTVNLPSYIDVNTQLSFSIDMKLTSGLTPICSIGIQFKNSGGTIIRSDEEGTFEMSTFNLRYYVTNNIPEGTTQITYFVRLITDNDATTTYELSAPLLSTGDNILNITQIPVQAADADTLDGLDSTQFLRSDIDATKTAGHLTLSDATQLRFGNSTDALLQQTVSDFRLRLNNFDEFRITDGSIGSRLRLYRATGNLWVSGEAEATNLRLNGGTTFSGLLDASGISLNQTWTLPNKSGTIALLDDITTQIPTLQNVTDNGNSTTNGISVNNILVGDGSVTSPSISFSNEGDVGIYRTGGVFGNGMSFAAEGIERVRISDVSGTLHTYGGVNIGSLGNGGQIRLESSSAFTGGLDSDGGYIVFPSGLGQGRFIFKSPGINYYAQFDQTAMTDERTYTLPDESGELSLTSDLASYYDIPTSNGRFMKLVSNETVSGLKTFTHPSGAIFSHSAPNIRFEDTDGGTNEKNTMIAATGNAWELRFYRDDYSINTAAIRVERIGDQPSHMFFNTPTMEVGGTITATDFIISGAFPYTALTLAGGATATTARSRKKGSTVEVELRGIEFNGGTATLPVDHRPSAEVYVYAHSGVSTDLIVPLTVSTSGVVQPISSTQGALEIMNTTFQFTIF